MGGDSKIDNNYVWPVRGGQSSVLAVVKAGGGSGGITPSSGILIWAGATGTAVYPEDTLVTLTAAPNAGSTFAGWSGACTGTGDCQVTLGANTSVTATFIVDTLVAPVTTATPAGGSYNAPLAVTLTASEAATIRYTLNGATPTTGSPVYSSPIPISATTTLQFFAVDAAGIPKPSSPSPTSSTRRRRNHDHGTTVESDQCDERQLQLHRQRGRCHLPVQPGRRGLCRLHQSRRATAAWAPAVTASA